ncbi:MAG: hypothetical protein ACR2J8_05080 [Thermomicrobiales bacterium]
MDYSSFDRIARLLGGAATRRAGIGAVVSALASASFAGDIAARVRHIEPEGPCGDHKGKDNRCSKGSECCTGYCKKGKKGKTGRCRCLKRGKACTEDRNCCGGLPCTDGTCGASTPPETCSVCDNGCPYTSVSGAIAGEPAGATIKIDAGVYDDDLVISKDVTLTNCNGSAVTLRNSSANGRTITFDATVVTLPTLTITNLTITKQDAAGQDGGGIQGAGHLVLNGTTIIEDCQATTANGGNGGAVFIGQGDDNDKSSFLMTDSAIIRNCTAENGAAVYVNDYVESVVFSGNAKITGNTATKSSNGGGAVYIALGAVATFDANVEVSGNSATWKGAGIYFYGYGLTSTLTINTGAKITGNTATDGGGVFAEGSAGTKTIASGTVTGNTPNNCAGNVSC